MTINFTQGPAESRASRCKDLLPMLRDYFIMHGWNIPAQNFDNAHWFVAQKRSNRGDILTYAFKDLYYPNYGNPHMYMSFATNDSIDSVTGAYISAFNPLTNTLEHSYSGNTQINIASVTASSIPLSYYNATKNDTDISPYYVFYSMSFGEDWFYIKLRGNPSTTGYLNSHTYGGIFEYNDSLSPSIAQYRGLWGAFYPSGSTFAGYFTTPSTTESWTTATFTDAYAITDGTYGLLGYYKDLEFVEDNRPIGRTILYQFATNKFVVVPPSNVMFTASANASYVDEVHLFGTGDTKRVIYKRESNNSLLVWVADNPTNIMLTDVGNGYKVEWLNPDLESLMEIELYASTTGPINARTDAHATLIHTLASPSQGEMAQFIDTDTARYSAVDTYYLVVAKYNSLPDPQYTLRSEGSHVHTTRVVESFDVMTTNSYDPLVYEKSTDSRYITVYHNPMVSLAMETQDGTNQIVDSARPSTNAVLYSGTTSAKSVAGKIGNAYTLTGNNYISLPGMIASGWDPNHCSMSIWARHPGIIVDGSAIYATGNLVTYYTYAYSSYYFHALPFVLTNSATSTSVYPVTFLSGSPPIPQTKFRSATARHTIPIDNNWHHYLVVKNGTELSLYIDNEIKAISLCEPLGGIQAYYSVLGYETGQYWPSNVDIKGCPELSSTFQATHYIGKKTATTHTTYPFIEYGNFEVDVTEVFNEPLAKAQRDYLWNSGNGRITSMHGVDKAYRLIAIPGAAGHNITYKLLNAYNARGKRYIKFDVKSTRTGTNFKIGFGEAASDITIGSAASVTTTSTEWESKYVDISSVADQYKDTLQFMKIFIINDSADNVISIRNITASYTL